MRMSDIPNPQAPCPAECVWIQIAGFTVMAFCEGRLASGCLASSGEDPFLALLKLQWRFWDSSTLSSGLMPRNPNLAGRLPHAVAGRPGRVGSQRGHSQFQDGGWIHHRGISSASARCIYVLADVCCQTAFWRLGGQAVHKKLKL